MHELCLFNLPARLPAAGLISCVIWAVRDSAAGAPACIESHLLILRAGPQGTALSREEGAAADVAGDGSPGLSLVSSVLIAVSVQCLDTLLS